MKPRVPDVLEKGRVRETGFYPYCPGEWYGRFVVKGPVGDHLTLVASAGLPESWPFPPPAWEHVSVSVTGKPRCPTWEEMAWVKDLCWNAEECVVQYHPPRSEYVNLHPHCLHLWRAIGVEFPRPPAACVGPKGGAA